MAGQNSAPETRPVNGNVNPIMGHLAGVRVIRRVPIAEIVVRDRLRPADAGYVETLAASIKANGLTHPIQLRPLDGGYELVVGLHRLEAHILLGWPEIDAEVREMTPLQARCSEVEENLIRRDLDALDRAVFMAEYKKIWEELYPETGHGKLKNKRGKNNELGKDATVASFPPDAFSDHAAERTGLSKRTIARATQLYTELGSELIAAVRNTPIAGKPVELKRLQTLTPADRTACLGAFRAGARSVREALAQCGLGQSPVVELSSEEKQVRAFSDLWVNMTTKARRRALAFARVDQETIDQVVEAWRLQPKPARKATN